TWRKDHGLRIRASLRHGRRQCRQASRRVWVGLEVLEDRAVPAFFVAPTFAAGAGPAAMATGDFAGSGHLDVAVANEQSGTVSVLMGNGDGTFQPRVDYAAGTNPDALAFADIDGDGKPDLAVVSLTG